MSRLFLSLVLLAALLAAPAAPALAMDGDHAALCTDLNGDGRLNGADFAAHVVMHAHAGHFSGAMNPGVMHQGYSVCR